jgi:hypothetical protein
MKSMPRVLRVPDWDALIAAAAEHPAGACLAAASPGTARGVLAAPAAVARWIAEAGPQDAPDAALRLLVVGAEKLDAVDEGRWYQLVPVLLDRPGSVEVVLVGDRLHRRFDSPLRERAPGQPARMHVGRLSSYLEVEREPKADLALLFHPGFQKHRGWLEDGSLRRLHELGIPVVVLSYEADESEIERWVVGCYGFDAVDMPLLNPFFLDFSDGNSQVRWGRAMWRFWPRSAGHVTVDQARLDALDRLGDMVLHSIDLKQPALASYGQSVELRAARGGGTRRLIYVFDEFLVDPATAALFALRSGTLRPLGTLPAADMSTYPGSSAPDLAKAVWAADIKRRHLLDRYSYRPSPEALRHRGRAMHAELEDKVEQLFR